MADGMRGWGTVGGGCADGDGGMMGLGWDRTQLFGAGREASRRHLDLLLLVRLRLLFLSLSLSLSLSPALLLCLLRIRCVRVRPSVVVAVPLFGL